MTLLLALALASARPAPIPFALLVLGAIYTIGPGDRTIPAPIYGGALLLTGELAYWSLDERVREHLYAGAVWPRLRSILVVSGASVPVSALVLLAAEADVARSPVVMAAGAAAVLACVALLAVLARLPSGDTGPGGAGPEHRGRRAQWPAT